MYILGLSCYYHDSSAALLKDGVIVAGAEEERFTRKKHDTSFPINAVKYCLESQGITIDDVSHIGFYEKPFLKFERVLSQHLEMFPRSFKTFLSSMPSWMSQKLRVMKAIRKKLKYKNDVFFIEHHRDSCFLDGGHQIQLRLREGQVMDVAGRLAVGLLTDADNRRIHAFGGFHRFVDVDNFING